MAADNDGRTEPFDGVRDWIDALIDGRLPLHEMRELGQLICQRSDVRRYYVRYLHLHGCLRHLATSLDSLYETIGDDELISDQDPFTDSICVPAIRDVPLQADADGWQTEPYVSHTPSRSSAGNPARRSRSLAIVAAVAAVVLLVCVLFVSRWSDSGGAPPSAVATLTDSAGARWKGQAPANGQALMADAELELTEGLGRLRFGGSDVIVEGPARFTAVAVDRIRLVQGALWVRADSGSGFEVLTPGEIIKDLGTEFGVEVTPSRETSVHVFEGKVAVYPAGKNPSISQQILNQDEAIEFDANGMTLAKGKADPSEFVRPMQFAAALAVDQFADQKHPLLRDPALTVHLTFSEADGKPAVNPLSRLGKEVLFGDGHDLLSFPAIRPGRRPGTQALSFARGFAQCARIVNQTGADPLDFSGDAGKARPFTIAGWVKASPDAGNLACIATRGNQYFSQYALDIRESQFRFIVRDAGNNLYQVKSSQGPNGQWHFVAGVFDPAVGTICIYVDGALRGKAPGPNALCPVADKQYFRIGSYSGTTNTVDHGFEGEIDEIIMWQRPLGGEEIAALYRAAL
jgi:hypothetical protein